MSPNDFTLNVTTSDKSTELAVVDGRQARIATATGLLQQSLPAGLYKVQARLGPSVLERLVSLDQNRTLAIPASDFSFPTPVPLDRTATVHEYHEDAATRGSQMPPLPKGQGAILFVMARDWTADESGSGNPMAGLSLHGVTGNLLVDLAPVALVDGTVPEEGRDASAVSRVEVDPGAYRLRLTLADGSMLERSLIAVRDWQTQIFLLMHDYDKERRADLANGAVVMAQIGRRFDPYGRGERAAVLARYALIQHRRIANAVLQDLYELKFDDPILGLLAGHLLRRDDPDNKAIVEVMDNLRRMLGADHPDVRALEDAKCQTDDHSLMAPPMLRPSWDRVTAASLEQPDLLPSTPLFRNVENALLSSQPWLTWRVEEGTTLERAEESADRRKLRALKAFVDSYGQQPSPSRLFRLGGRALSALGFGAPAAASKDLALETKVELTKSLGVSGRRLDAMLTEVQSQQNASPAFALFQSRRKPETA
jgi:hypothetical protein